MNPIVVAGAIAAGLLIVAALSGLRVIAEHERGVVLRLGRRGPVLGPGPRLILPLGIDRLRRVDLRTRVLPLPALEVMTSDGVPLGLTAAMHLQVVNPLLAATRVADLDGAALQLGHAALREASSRATLRTVLTETAALRDDMAQFTAERAQPWGVAVTAVDVIEVRLPAALRRAMEAPHVVPQGSGAASLADDDEPQIEVAAQRLIGAARLLAEQPEASQRRYLEAVALLSREAGAVIVVPVPVPVDPPSAPRPAELRGRSSRATTAHLAGARPDARPEDAGAPA